MTIRYPARLGPGDRISATAPGYSQLEAVVDALSGLGGPLIASVECGHLPPFMTLVNGARATVTWSPPGGTITQSLT
jgi:muramoyltetrapeptide carboxypeptidase LdcA involved in peptidoglycan recycling